MIFLAWKDAESRESSLDFWTMTSAIEMNIPATLEAALKCHQAGRLEEAERLCRQILAVDASQLDAWHVLGLVVHQAGRSELAIQYLRESIRLKSDFAGTRFSLGNVLRDAGKTAEAIESYQHCLRLQPGFAEAHYNLGNAFNDQKQAEKAAECFRQAVQLRPNYVKALNNLGNTLLDLERPEEAAEVFERTIKLNPNYAAGHSNLGSALRQLGRLEEAVVHCRKSLELAPGNCQSLNNLGAAYMDLRRHEEAATAFEQALQINPAYIKGRCNLAAAYRELGKLKEAIDQSRQVLQREPENSEALNVLGAALMDNGGHEEAVRIYQQMVKLDSDSFDAHRGLGTALWQLGRLEDAVTHCEKAVALNPENTEALDGLAVTFLYQGRIKLALEAFDRALATRPDFPDARTNRAIAYLISGDFDRGWSEYEWRWKTKAFPARNFSQPLWDGGDLNGRTILVHSEQGLGDSLHFVRYLTCVRQRGARVLFECPQTLHPLLTGCCEIDELVAAGKPLPHFDVHAPLLSLPHLLKQPDPKLAPQPPYLFADPQRIDRWKAELSQLDGFKVGINWQGNPKHSKDSFRSIPLAQFVRLADVPGVQLVNLQKGFGKEQLAECKERDRILDLASQLDVNTGAFLDTAAALHSLDLVITSDTALAHLAGALGRPVWLALSAAPDWRWLLTEETTPWYPSMRLFRQSKLGDWSTVFAQVAAELERLAGASASPPPVQTIKELLEAACSRYQAQRYAEAERLCRQVIARNPQATDAWHVLGLVMEQTEHRDLALEYVREALRLKPDFAEAHSNLGILYQSDGQPAEALEASKRCLKLAPSNADAHGNMGDALRELGREEEAIAAYQEALRHDPKHPVALNNLGMVFLDRGQYAKAAPYFQQALAASPDYPMPHRNMAMIHLRTGEYRAGWAEYEWRWQTKPFVRPKLPKPPWDGSDLTGKAILIYAEQGLGDSLHFIRYLSLLRQRGARVIFGCPPKLEPLLKNLACFDVLVAEGQRLPAFDLHAPLLSLPHLLNLPDPQDSPRTPYLFADSALTERWKGELEKVDGFRVGISWQGSPANKKDPTRSIPLTQFLPLLEIDGVRLISLQKGFGREQLDELPQRDRILDLATQLDEAAGPFMDTAAALQSLDLVVTADTALAHLAGGMGRPVWVALSAVPDWRWLLTGNETPWYPSMRLFRQAELGDWSPVFSKIAAELRQLAASR